MPPPDDVQFEQWFQAEVARLDSDMTAARQRLADARAEVAQLEQLLAEARTSTPSGNPTAVSIARAWARKAWQEARKP